MNTPRMPAVFIGHGSPMNALEKNRYTLAWRQLGRSIPRPRAILAISAHWYIQETAVTAMAAPRTIHDFFGFPPTLLAQRYCPPGDPALAARVRAVLHPIPVGLDQTWGLDHGVWSVLIHCYPEADVPVLQLSIDSTRDAEYHYHLGRQLAVLREEGVLILGSGNVVHNLRMMRRNADAAAYPWAANFNDSIRNAIAGRDHGLVLHPERLSEAAALSVPTMEHYLPLLYVLGTAAPMDTVSFPTDGIELGAISMLSVLVGGA